MAQIVYYNEHDHHAAAWLCNLADGGHIPDGTIDQSDIRSVTADVVRPFGTAHFFGGIGGWPLALELAGWPRERPVWTGSCPCQPFSSAGKGLGVADPRHLWPAFRSLIAECRPPVVFGEQVASRAGREWLAGVRLDLEALGYAVGAADLCAAGVGAPHIRQRLYWVADRDSQRFEGRTQPDGHQVESSEPTSRRADSLRCGVTGGLAVSPIDRLHKQRGDAGSEVGPRGPRRDELTHGSFDGGVGHTSGDDEWRTRQSESILRRLVSIGGSSSWGDFDLIPCRDGKARRVEPGTFPLVAGLPQSMVRGRDSGSPIHADNAAEARVMRLKGYGNAIVPAVAATFVRAFMETELESSLS